MARTLAHGRLTKVDPGETIRQQGFTNAYGDKAPPGAHMDQLIFEAQGYEHILGSAAQVAADFATITYDQVQQRFEDKTGSEVVLQDYDRIAVIGMDTLTANMVIDNVIGLEMFHIGNTAGQSGDDPKFKLGDSGGGVPYKIIFGSNTERCKLDLMTDIDFLDLQQFFTDSITIYNARYISNQGLKNHIVVNGYEIYNPGHAGEILICDTMPKNPYPLRMDGQIFAWRQNGAADPLTWYRDLNIALDGIRFNGTSQEETNSRFTTPAIITASPYLSQVNTARRFMTDISALDTRIHQRTDANGVSKAQSANFSIGSNIVTLSGLVAVKNNMRINGASAQGIPDGAAGTTILRNINTSINTAEMYDALTMNPVNATVTASGIAVTFDNSGAAGGAYDLDYTQGHWHNMQTAGAGSANLLNSAFGTGPSTANTTPAGWSGSATNPLAETTSPISDGINGIPRTHDQTQPQSTGIYYYYKP